MVVMILLCCSSCGCGVVTDDVAAIHILRIVVVGAGVTMILDNVLLCFATIIAFLIQLIACSAEDGVELLLLLLLLSLRRRHGAVVRLLIMRLSFVVCTACGEMDCPRKYVRKIHQKLQK